MTEEFWANSQFSIARYTGIIQINDVHYIIVNKEGKDIFECSLEAECEERDMAIPPGEPCDLIDVRFQPYYRKMGREKFIEFLKSHQYVGDKMLLKELKEMSKKK